MERLEVRHPVVPHGDVWYAQPALLPPGPELERRARTTGALRRKRGVRGASDLLRVVLSYGFCGLSLELASEWAQANHSAKMSSSAILRRLRGCASWLEELLAYKLNQRVSAAPVAGLQVRLVDATRVCTPGSKGDSWRIHASYDPWQRQLVQLNITDNSGGERLDRFDVRPGELLVGDRAYGRRRGLAHVVRHGGEFLVRITWYHVPLETRDGKPFDLLAELKSLPQDGVCEFDVRVKADERHSVPAIPCRLVAKRKPAKDADEGKRRAKAAARKGGHKLDEKTLEACEYFFVLTSLPSSVASAEQVLALYRLRWQIEIAFKRLKSLLKLDDLRAKTPSTVRAALAAKMLGAVLVEDLVNRQRDERRHWQLTQIMGDSFRQAILGSKAAAMWLSKRVSRERTPHSKPTRPLQCQATRALLA